MKRLTTAVGGVLLALMLVGAATAEQQTKKEQAQVAQAAAQTAFKSAVDAVEKETGNEQKAEENLKAKGGDPGAADDKQPKEAKAAKRAYNEKLAKLQAAERWRDAAKLANDDAAEMVAAAVAIEDDTKKVEALQSKLASATGDAKAAAQGNLDEANKVLDEKGKDFSAASDAYRQHSEAAQKQADLYGTSVKTGPAEPLYATEHAFVEAGAVGRSPFTIKSQTDPNSKKTTFYLDDSGTADVQAYVQLRVRKRDAWDKAREEREPEDWFGPCQKKNSQWDCSKWARSLSDTALLHPDFDVRIGFNFGQSSDTSATTVAGTGDLNVSGALGFPFLQLHSGGMVHTLNVEGIFESVTDRSVQDIHFREGIGFAWAMGWLNRPLDIVGSGNELPSRVYELLLRPTANILESPNLDGSTVSVNGVDRSVVKTRSSTQKPAFETRYGAFGLDIDFLVPYGERGYLTLGASLFGGNVNPDPWMVRLGTTIPLEQIVGVFLSPATKQ